MIMKKWHVFVLIILILAVFLVAYKEFNKAHRSVSGETGIAVDAISLFKAFELNEREANERYLNKIITVSGKISEVSRNQDGKVIILLDADNPMFGVNCTLEQPAEHLEKGQMIKVKGICTGYLSDVVVVDGILEQ